MAYAMKALACDPARIKGMSEKLIVSHYENNYGGAVNRLNAITAQLAELDFAKAPGFVINGLKREELIASNSMILHELFFASLGEESAPCRSPIETSPASPIEMSRSSVCVRLVGVAWDDGDHDEPQRADAPAGADRCCRRTPVGRRRDRTNWRRAKTDLPTATSLPC